MASIHVCALALPMLGGCVLPLQFEEQVDAGADDNNPPYIDPVATYRPMNDPSIQVDLVRPAEEFTVVLFDRDVGDTLFMRIFRDYHTERLGPVTDREVPPSGTLTRTTNFSTSNWCGTAPVGSKFIFEVLVSDRQFLDFTIEPVYRAVPPGAKTARGYWIAECR